MSDEEIRKKIEKLLKNNPGVYSEDEQEELFTQFDQSQDQNRFVKQVESNLKSAATLKRFKENLDRQKKEVKAARDYPGRIEDLEGLSRQMMQMMGVEAVRKSKTHRWSTHRDGYGDAVGLNAFSASGGFKKDLIYILSRDEPIIHASLPDIAYQRNLVNAGNYLKELEEEVTADRRSLLKKGSYQSKEDKRSQDSKSEAKRLAQGAKKIARVGFDEISRSMSEAGEALGFLTTPSEKDKRYSNFIKARNEALAAAVWDLNDKDNQSNIERLKECDQILDKCDGILDSDSFRSMQKLIDDRLVPEDQKKKKQKIKELEDRLNELNNQMLAQMDQIKEDENAMWKLRALQLVLILTPFGAFSFIGLDYMELLGNVFGPLFDSSMSIGEGMNYSINNELDFVGKSASAFGVDEMSQFLFDDIPITGDIFSAINVLTGSDLGQMGVALAGNALQTDAALFAIAAGGVIWGLTNEIDHRETTNKIIDGKHKELEKIFEEYRKDTIQQKSEVMDGDGEKMINATKYAHQRLQVFQDMYRETKFLNFLKELDPNKEDDKALFNIFKDIRFKVDGENKTLSDIGNKGLDKLFSDENREYLNEALKRFMAIDYLKGEDVYKNIAPELKNRALEKAFGQLINKEGWLDEKSEQVKQDLGNQFLIEFFKKNIGIIGSEYQGLLAKADKINNLPQKNESEKKILQRDCGVLKGLFIEMDAGHIASLTKRSDKIPNTDKNPSQPPQGPSPNPSGPAANPVSPGHVAPGPALV